MTRLATWLVAGRTVYRIIESGERDVRCEIMTGSDRVRGREITIPRSQIQAAIRLGEMRAARNRPAIIDQQLAQEQMSKLDQEAALTTAKAAHWKGTKPDEPDKTDQAASPGPHRRATWDDNQGAVSG